MKWCSVSHTSSKPSSSDHSICSSSLWMMLSCRTPGGAWKKKKVPKRISVSHSGQILDRLDHGREIFAAAPGGDGGGGELLGEAGERQGHAEARALVQHELEVLQEQVELHLRLEVARDHERATHVEHPRGGGALAQDREQARGIEAALGAEHERLGGGGRVESDQQVRGELGEHGVARLADVHSLARDGAEG